MPRTLLMDSTCRNSISEFYTGHIQYPQKQEHYGSMSDQDSRNVLDIFESKTTVHETLPEDSQDCWKEICHKLQVPQKAPEQLLKNLLPCNYYPGSWDSKVGNGGGHEQYK